jgi:hypothetical protein
VHDQYRSFQDKQKPKAVRSGGVLSVAGERYNELCLREGCCSLRCVISTEEHYAKSRESLLQRLLSLDSLRQLRSIL